MSHTSPPSTPPPSTPPPTPSTSINRHYRNFILALLTLIYVFNFIDRQIIGILSPSIQKDLDLTYSQLGLLKGVAFALFYTLIGLPIAWLADRYNRVNILSLSLAIWSSFTALTGMANSFLFIALARVGVGIGEAGGSPPSHSIISDLYPAQERGRALSIYALGIPFGIMFAYFAAGQLEENYGWRMTFVILGIPGIILAILTRLVLREPVRGAQENMRAGHVLPKVSFLTAAKTLASIPSWWAMCFGITMASFTSYSISAWQIDYLKPAFPDYSFVRLTTILGIFNGFIYGASTFLGGYIADKWARKSVRSYAYICIIAALGALPAVMVAFWAPTMGMHLMCTAVYLFFAGLYLGPSFSIAQTLAPINMRALSTALFFLVINLIALGGGPSSIGILSDLFVNLYNYNDVDAIRLSLYISGSGLVLSAIAFSAAAYFLPKDWEKAKQRNQQLSQESA